jgi:hypothetical protein
VLQNPPPGNGTMPMSLEIWQMEIRCDIEKDVCISERNRSRTRRCNQCVNHPDLIMIQIRKRIQHQYRLVSYRIQSKGGRSQYSASMFVLQARFPGAWVGNGGKRSSPFPHFTPLTALRAAESAAEDSGLSLWLPLQ